MPVPGRLTVDAGHNGGVKGWGPTGSEACLIAGRIPVETAGGILRAAGPATRDSRGWAVSREVFAPQLTGLNLSAHNGGVHLTRVAGDVTDYSNNGGIHVEMATAEAS